MLPVLRSSAVVLCLAACVLGHVPACAQVAAAEASVDTSQKGPPPGLVVVPDGCLVVASAADSDGVHELVANCAGKGLLLGRASAYEAFPNAALKAAVVDIRLGTERRVLMVSVGRDGFPVLENITTQIARAAGGGIAAGIADVDVDFRGFADSGSLAVTARSTDGGAKAIALEEQLAWQRTR
jgi:hypothetical protein